jgi:hypothetical protein
MIGEHCYVRQGWDPEGTRKNERGLFDVDVE